MRKLIGKIIEWFLDYTHVVYCVGGKAPDHKYDGDAGYDLYCSADTEILPHTSVNVPSELHIQSRDRLWFNIKGRSSTMKVKGLQVIEAVIDNDYTGEMFTCVYNPSNETKIVLRGDRIAQVIPCRLIRCQFRYTKNLKPTKRGMGGFGSTGR